MKIKNNPLNNLDNQFYRTKKILNQISEHKKF